MVSPCSHPSQWVPLVVHQGEDICIFVALHAYLSLSHLFLSSLSSKYQPIYWERMSSNLKVSKKIMARVRICESVLCWELSNHWLSPSPVLIKPWFAVFADYLGINDSPSVSCKLPTQHHWNIELGRHFINSTRKYT